MNEDKRPEDQAAEILERYRRHLEQTCGRAVAEIVDALGVDAPSPEAERLAQVFAQVFREGVRAGEAEVAAAVIEEQAREVVCPNCGERIPVNFEISLHHTEVEPEDLPPAA